MKVKEFALGHWLRKKIILPIKKNIEAYQRRVRLSLSWRLALNYLRLWIISGVLFFLLFQVLYIYVTYNSYAALAEKTIVRFESKGKIFIDEVNPYYEHGIYLTITDLETNEIVYSDLDIELKQFSGILKYIHFDASSRYHRLIMEDGMDFQIGSQAYEALFYYNMTNDYKMLNQLTFNLILIYILLLFFTIKEGKKNNAKVLSPIQEMSLTAGRLTASNLSSERINVEGTNNELKDLAIVFNDMLDRLDNFYENQKQFVSNASHELRTPIAVIQGYSNMLNRWGSRDASVLQESVVAIQMEASAMQSLVEKLLFLSRHDKRTLKLDKRLFNIKPLIEDMVKETEMVVLKRNIEGMVLENVVVYGDKQSLKQAIRVFIDNAVKYTNDGDSIRISCRNIDGDCVIGVEDTGIGMEQKDLNNLFERFYRSDEVRNRKIEGHGLGLSIAKLIISAHTGRIRIRTQFMKGTSFFITIPRKRSHGG